MAAAENATAEAFAAVDWVDETVDAIDAKITKIEAEIRAKIERIKQEAREKRQNFWARLKEKAQAAWNRTKEFFSQAKESFLSKLRGNQTEKVMQLIITIIEKAQQKGEQVDIAALTGMLDALAEAKMASKKSVEAARNFINIIANMPGGARAAAAA
jgi:hypothetical protein